ncbi:MAG: DUF1445 domain-containing protein [Lautropia sp.]
MNDALTPLAVRRLARAGRWPGSTRGAVEGVVQCNLVVLPGAEADAFGAWCERNAEVAPVIARTAPGVAALPALGEDLDLRFDLPAYNLFERGQRVGEVPDLAARWREDTVGFVFGCSFSLEDALRAHGIPLDYEARGFGGAIYLTNRPTVAAGAYAGPLVVSMRPLPAAWTERAVAVSRQYPLLHGAPVHVGDPGALGLRLDEPMQSLGPPSIADGEVPVFWACGVTTQLVLANANPVWAASHVSARMLVTDVPISAMHVAG